jgi:hypothetical protein
MPHDIQREGVLASRAVEYTEPTLQVTLLCAQSGEIELASISARSADIRGQGYSMPGARGYAGHEEPTSGR